MSHILGIDASTSVTAWVILEDDPMFDSKKHLLLYEAVEFKGKSFKTFWDKCDHVREQLRLLKVHQPTIDKFFIEEPMKRFSPGFSSAETISVLQRFNGIVCYFVRDMFGTDPVYVNVSSARKAAGVHVTTKAKADGKNAKQQTFEHVTSNELSHMSWPTKRNSTQVKQFVFDIVDAYVVARGGMELYK